MSGISMTLRRRRQWCMHVQNSTLHIHLMTVASYDICLNVDCAFLSCYSALALLNRWYWVLLHLKGCWCPLPSHCLHRVRQRQRPELELASGAWRHCRDHEAAARRPMARYQREWENHDAICQIRSCTAFAYLTRLHDSTSVRLDLQATTKRPVLTPRGTFCRCT